MTNLRPIFARGRALALIALITLLSACGGGAETTGQYPDDVELSVGELCWYTQNHHDGDTFDCVTATDSFTVRLSAVDAPELNQSYGYAARDALAALTPDGTHVSCYKTDRYGRQICRVYTPDLSDVQAALLAQGMVWYAEAYSYEQTSDEISLYTRLTMEAQDAYRGLWEQRYPQAPWDCRSTQVCR